MIYGGTGPPGLFRQVQGRDPHAGLRSQKAAGLRRGEPTDVPGRLILAGIDPGVTKRFRKRTMPFVEGLKPTFEPRAAKVAVYPK